MEKNFKLVIEYDGSSYHGWQSQKEAPTIQATIEQAIAKMTRSHIPLYGSGRTDAGVHALGQVAHFTCGTRLDAAEFESGLNSLLPDDIVIRSCRQVHIDFHARYDARRKTYRYRILNRKRPAAIGRQYVWHVRSPLDIEVMRQCAALLKGAHAFDAFEGSGSPRSSTVRTVFRADWRRADEDLLVFEIEADGFLRFMVRNLVGTLVSAGLGKMTVADVSQVLESRDRRNAPATAPAKGLFLIEVAY